MAKNPEETSFQRLISIILAVSSSRIVKNIELNLLRLESDSLIIKMKLTLSDDSELFVSEYYSKKELKYSYHWQDKHGNLRIRWDNSKHYKNISTFLHHKHVGRKENVEESDIKSLKDVLLEIEISHLKE